jgi:hypothetical protein
VLVAKSFEKSSTTVVVETVSAESAGDEELTTPIVDVAGTVDDAAIGSVEEDGDIDTLLLETASSDPGNDEVAIGIEDTDAEPEIAIIGPATDVVSVPVAKPDDVSGTILSAVAAAGSAGTGAGAVIGVAAADSVDASSAKAERTGPKTSRVVRVRAVIF